ncbi:unnamed protein product [Caenorhabditis bovis]|uniref:Methylthioribose-1-phosphate isomerase n=1 Tax=Caenorhabditis bovis TaxID=2654633 RepID=A0A8S1EAY3_9PELO|nr:unnamed protein product [Caenorhabditis bovis]
MTSGVVNGPIPDSFLFDESKRLNSLVYKEGKLEVLDQLLLPHEFKYIPINGVNDAYDVIKSMKVRGAPLIATVGCLGLLIELKNRSDFDGVWLEERINYLISSRPTAIDLRNSLNCLLPIIHSKSSNVEKMKKIYDHLIGVYETEKEENRKLVWNGYQELISAFPNDHKLTVMTICNTGSLATCSWGTALGVIRALHSENRLKLAYVLETRPYNQGIRLTSTELLHGNVPFRLITDSMAAWVMKNDKVDAILVGADNVALNGDTANKIGTYMLAVLAKHHNIRFYPVVPATSINRNNETGAGVTIEERPAKELLSINGQFIGSPNTPVWNPAFDETPAELITKIITDFGNFEPVALKNAVLNR